MAHCLKSRKQACVAMVRRIWFNLKDLKENKRFMKIGPTMATWHGGVGVIFFQNLVKIDFE